MHRKALGWTLLLTLTVGCAGTPPKSMLADESTPERIRLRNFVEYLTNRVDRAADQIAQQVDDPSIDRNTVYWKLRVVPMARRALLRADDQSAVMQLWLLSATMVEIMSASAGALLMGDGQSIAVNACKEIDVEASSVASTLLDPKQFAVAKDQVKAFVKEHLNVVGDEIQWSAEDVDTWTSTVSSILKKPFHMLDEPLSSLNPTSGLSDTALAVQNFTDEFTMARRQLETMPREVRWNTQLVLMEALESLQSSSLVKELDEISASASSLAATAQALPGDLTALVKDIDASQSNLQATLREADTTITDATAAAQAIDTMGTSLTGAFEAFAKVLVDLGLDGKPDPPPSPETSEDPSTSGPPFDINDYGRTAEKVTRMANALATLLTNADGISNTKEPPPLLVDTETAARSLVDRIALVAAAFVLFCAVTAYGYRRAVGRLKKI